MPATASASPLQDIAGVVGLHLAGAGRLLHRDIGVHAVVAVKLRKVVEPNYGSMGETQKGTQIDSNNGIRARLQVCNPNPNRVKEERKSTATARGGKMAAPLFYTGVRQEQKRTEHSLTLTLIGLKEGGRERFRP